MINYFENQREFSRKFPSKIYLCDKCKKMTTDDTICTNCGAQANRMFADNYKYKIGSNERIIFKPIELLNDIKKEV